MGGGDEQGFADLAGGGFLHGRVVADGFREVLSGVGLWCCAYGLSFCVDRRGWAGCTWLGDWLFFRSPGTALGSE